MSEWNPVTTEQAIHRIAQDLSKSVLACDQAYRQFLAADHEFDLAEARAYLDAREKGSPAHACGYEATLATAEQRKARDVADAAHRLTDKNMKALLAELDAMRSIGASVREAYRVAGRGEQ